MSIPLHPYWARFVPCQSRLFRFDTRVYLRGVPKCRSTDTVIGAVVAKNPGSARPSDSQSRALQPIELANDRLIPTVRSFVLKAYRMAGVAASRNAYIQVLNLFYLCEKDFGCAIRGIGSMVNPPADPAESNVFPWIMYLWGKYECRKAHFIRRFSRLDSENHFYVDKNLNQIVRGIPGRDSFARHTQGLKLEPVVAHLASLLRNTG
jgi:hypothetical protein